MKANAVSIERGPGWAQSMSAGYCAGAALSAPESKEKDQPSPWADELKFLLKVSRPGFWLTSVWFYLLPVGGAYVFGSWKFWLGCFYVTFPLGLLIYGWNDMVDYETDRHNPRKDTFLFGANATPEQLRGLPLRIALVQLPFIVLFFWLEGWRMLPWVVALVCATAIYKAPSGRFEARPPLELLNQMGYLLVFVIASWLNDMPQLPWLTFLFGALFAIHSNLFGQIMDVVPDRLAGRSTSALMLGLVPAKWLLVLLLTVETAIVFRFSGDRVTGAFLGLAALWFAADATVFWRDRLYQTWHMRLFLLGWNAVALLTMPLVWRNAALTGVVR